MNNIDTWAYCANPNKMYLVSKQAVEHVAPSNLPRLNEGDVVVIKRQELYGKAYWEKQGIKSYTVKVIKKLSVLKRKNKDSSSEIRFVPEIILIPI